MSEQKKRLIIGFMLISLIVITIGISYAFFTYIKQGSTENTITTGNLTFVYDEKDQSGNGISLTNAMPMSDEEAIPMIGSNQAFDFQVTATTKGSPVAYEVIASKEENSTFPEEMIKIYLTTLSGEIETPIKGMIQNNKVITYNTLEPTTIANQTGKTLYQELIPESSKIYQKQFRLRMWISENATDVTDGRWDYSGKTFAIKINVVANNSIPASSSDDCYTITQKGVITAYNCSYKDVVIPTRVKEIEVKEIARSVFLYKGLKSVILPETLEKIGSDAFNGNGLSEVIIPDSVTSIADQAFKDNLISKLKLPEKITYLGARVFSINRMIGDAAFIYNRNSVGTEDRTSLNSYAGKPGGSVVIPDGVTKIGGSCFADMGLTSITIPKSVITIGTNAFINNKLPDDQAFIYKRNADGSEDKTTIISYGGANRTNVIIPEGVTTIGAGAFSWSGITNVTFPSTLKTIGSSAFYYDKLENLNIPNSVTTIGAGAFANNQLPDDQAFIYNRKSDGTEDKTILNSYAGKNRINVQIPSNVTIIGTRAFQSAKMTSITIPQTVKKIREAAFQGNSLTSVIIPSSVTSLSPTAFDSNVLIIRK